MTKKQKRERFPPPCPQCRYVYKEHVVGGEWILPYQGKCCVCGFDLRLLKNTYFNYRKYQHNFR